MGNQKFKLSYMIPNSWFHKLKDNNNKPSKPQSTKLKRDNLPPPPSPLPPSSDSSTLKTTNDPPKISKLEPQCHPRKSYHITRELIAPPQELDFLTISPPRKSKSSSKSRKSSRRTNSTSSCSCKSTATTFQSYPSKSNSPTFEDALLKTEHKTEDFDIVIDISKESLYTEINTFNCKLPPIITKKEAQKPRKITTKEEKLISSIMQEQRISTPSRGVRLKMNNSPKIMGIKQGQNGNIGRKSTSSKKRRSISESFAVVKSSFDPQRDFKESMVEMIVQNNLRGAKDLEDLLACYLSLNADEYHDVIIKVFKQIWFDTRHQK